ncbi:PREDICTED: CSC1-like protein 2 isoform X2 [Amphimedon queenslandica]|uniref:CSC1/OSCA1-like 7TM region domain-containing protein n=1 Tax=Amphimedon queenslandica TaxID=400682 RepID=A0AAN0IZJ2_AMPQE|nr:PREDICTED: CSC1-like protein 2 isoform X2 [Amphimedon queenslandica]|eukprot:XP_019850189.1 PREDICTED: CSC1-like protein 2 isoform X2 [Amphimedon queenslandica]
MSSFNCSPVLSGSDAKDGGVPLTLALNISFATVILIAFCLMHVFLKDFIMAAVKNKRHKVEERGGEEQEGEEQETESDGDDTSDEDRNRRRRGSSFMPGRDYCETIVKFFTMRERDVRVRSGPDASLYLMLQLYLLIILIIFSFFSIVFILPVNYLSGDLQEKNSFARTTVANLKGESKALWTHVLFSVLYVIIAGVFMIHYYLRLGKLQHQVSSHTIMIYGIPSFVHVEDLMQHFEEALPGTQIIDIRFAYDINDLQKKWKKLKEANNNLQIAEAYEAETGRKRMIHSSNCNCSNDDLVDAKEFYLTKVDHLKVAVAMERSNALAHKLPIAFVTFAKGVTPKVYVESYRPCRRTPQSSLSDSINSNNWELFLSPLSWDLIWENLSSNRVIWWLRWFALNLILILFVIFFTTPPVILNSSEEIWIYFKHKAGELNITIKNATGYGVPGFVQSYFASFLSILLASLMMYCITKSVAFEYHWSKSRVEQTTLRKAFLFLSLQVIVLPSLGLTSLSAVAALIARNDEVGIDNQLSCVFLPNNGAYFVAYIIIATFVWSPLELLRLRQLAIYIYRRIRAKTKLEKRQIIREYDFKFGSKYASNLIIFTMTSALSLTTPLVVPFGALFFGIKYLIDKYNLLYGYKPVYVSGRQYLHKSAMKLVMVGVVFVQFVTLFYSVVREGSVSARSIVLLVLLIVTGLLLFGLLVLGWFSYLLPKIRIKMGQEYSIFGLNEEEEDRIVEPGEYVAPVLMATGDEIPGDTVEQHLDREGEGKGGVAQSYESFGRTIAGGQIKLSPSRRSDAKRTREKERPPSLVVEEEDGVVEEEGDDIENEIKDN